MNIQTQINFARRTASFRPTEQGYKCIGTGAFSRAYVHPDAPDIVVKVGRRSSKRFHNLKDGFPLFAEAILTSRISSKFYPKIYEFRWSEDRTRFLCIMRRYHHHTRPKIAVAHVAATADNLRGLKHYGRGKPSGRFKRALAALIPYPSLSLDIHGGNVLGDDKGTPIFIDPLVINNGYLEPHALC